MGFILTPKTVTSGGPNPSDAFSLGFRLGDTSASPSDATSFAFGFPDTLAGMADAVSLGLLLDDTTTTVSDAFLLGVKAAESSVAPTDAATYALGIAQDDTVSAASDALKLGLSYPDTNTAPSDLRASTGQFWLSGTTGTSGNTTNPANLNGPNNAVNGSAKTVALGATTAALTSNVGAGIPAATPVNSAIYRGWFNYTGFGAASTGTIVMHSSSALFADITMATVTTSLDSTTGTFTFDLIAAGVNTLAELQSCQVIHRTVDTVAGVGGTASVDAGRIELTNII